MPQGWLGVVADGPLTVAHAGEWDAMVGAGVESVRTAVRWYELQPYGSAAEVPPADAARFRDAGGVPTDFSALDAVVAGAAARGLQVLPVVQATPGWAATIPGDITSPPADPATFGRFVAALAGRYGPRGHAVGGAARPAPGARPRVADLERAEPHALLVRAAVRAAPTSGCSRRPTRRWTPRTRARPSCSPACRT